jgi:hypothetical protein
MSLKEELRNLDHETLATAVASVVGRSALGSESVSDLAHQLHDHQPYLGKLPDVISRTMQELMPGLDEQQLQPVRAGMTLIASVLCEYADLAELQAQFPDMPSES